MCTMNWVIKGNELKNYLWYFWVRMNFWILALDFIRTVKFVQNLPDKVADCPVSHKKIPVIFLVKHWTSKIKAFSFHNYRKDRHWSLWKWRCSQFQTNQALDSYWLLPLVQPTNYRFFLLESNEWTFFRWVSIISVSVLPKKRALNDMFFFLFNFNSYFLLLTVTLFDGLLCV